MLESIEQLPSNNDWAVTDNTTITDASIVFQSFAEGNTDIPAFRLENWNLFIESFIFHGVLIADNRIFHHHPHIQLLKSYLGDNIQGIDFGDEHRNKIKTQVRQFCRPIKKNVADQIPESLNQLYESKNKSFQVTFDRLNRGLFYSTIASELNLPYLPCRKRHDVFENVFLI